MSSLLVDALYDAVTWCDHKRFTNMHAALSIAGRCHTLSGVAVAALQLGITTTKQPAAGEFTTIHLGPAGKTYYLKQRADLTDTESVVQGYIDYATQSTLHWPDRETSFLDFARQVSLLMVACHSLTINGVGLRGGKTALKDMKARSARTATPLTGRQPALRLDGKIEPGPYVVPHVVRHFLIAADRLGVFDYEALTYLDIDEYVPDVTRQTVKVADFNLARIKADFGLDPFHLSWPPLFCAPIS